MVGLAVAIDNCVNSFAVKRLNEDYMIWFAGKSMLAWPGPLSLQEEDENIIWIFIFFLFIFSVFNINLRFFINYQKRSKNNSEIILQNRVWCDASWLVDRDFCNASKSKRKNLHHRHIHWCFYYFKFLCFFLVIASVLLEKK